jgi:hypothetical protein
VGPVGVEEGAWGFAGAAFGVFEELWVCWKTFQGLSGRSTFSLALSAIKILCIV